jgi:hypothetical protein
VLVVEERSACLDGVEAIGIGADHFQMNKFTSPSDGYFKLVRNQIQVMVGNAFECLQSEQLPAMSLCYLYKQILINSL